MSPGNYEQGIITVMATHDDQPSKTPDLNHRVGSIGRDVDGESGDEGLSPEADAKRSLFALRAMLDRGVIDEKTFEDRAKAFTGKIPGAE